MGPRAERGLAVEAALEQHAVQLAIGVHGEAYIAGIDLLAVPDAPRDATRLDELPDGLRLGLVLRLALFERQTARLHHPSDEVVELEQRVVRIVRETLLEVLPLRFPLMPVETGLLHGVVVPRSESRETRR